MKKTRQKPREWWLAVRGERVYCVYPESDADADAARGWAGWALVPGWALVRVREVLPLPKQKRKPR